MLVRLRLTFCYGIRCGVLHFTDERIHAGDDLANFSEKHLSLRQVVAFLKTTGRRLAFGLNTVNRSAFISASKGQLFKIKNAL